MSRSILLYGDVNAAYRDGSRIWLESIVEVLGRTGSEVTLLLKAFPPEGAASFGEGLDCTIVDPAPDHRSRGAGMNVAEARGRILELDAIQHFDIVLTRGYAIAKELSTAPQLTGRLWPYITDGPGFDPFRLGEEEELARIAHHARRILVQTEDARSVWESRVPAATGKTLLLPPMIPDETFDLAASRIRGADLAPEDLEPSASSASGAGAADSAPSLPARGSLDEPLRLVYSGKFARAWKSLEIPYLPDRLAARGIHSRLSMIGDKIHHSPDDTPFPGEMQAVIADHLETVTWEGGFERREALELVSRADVGLGWRESGLDSSLEISTKLLEYAALGTAPVANRTRAHERLLGPEYPLFVDDDVADALERACDPEILQAAAQQAHEAVQPYRFSRCAERLEQYFTSLEPDLESSPLLPSPHPEGPLRVLFSSHDFKFSGELLDTLSQREDIELRIDTWQRLAQHDVESSSADGDWADVIICEWAGHNAVFHSQRKRDDQRLIVRFHGFEIRGAWLKDIVVDAVDAFVFVSDFYRREILEKTGWPESRTTVIPNIVDVIDLDRDKVPDARFHLGMAGYVPMLKRPDRALDLFERLVAEDDRLMLHVRGRAPWTYPWEWAKPLQRNAYEALLDRIRRSRTLRRRVLFEPFSPDMGSWFRGIGWILSPSVHETFHLAPVEGMASGAVPLVWSRPGASEIFGDALFDDVESIARTVLRAVREPGTFDELSRAAKALARTFDVSEHRTSWLDLLEASRSTPLPLRGVPLFESIPPEGPRNAAQVAAVAEQEMTRGGDSRAALDALSLPTAEAPEGSHVARRLLALRESALLLEGLRSGSWIPTAGLGPVFQTRRAEGSELETIRLGSDEESSTNLDASTFIQPVPLAATPILTAADSLVTAARRERPCSLRAPADAGGIIATTIAARRTGIRIELDPAWSETLRAADEHIPGISEAFTTALQRSEAPVDLADLTVGLIADTFTARAVSSAVRTVALPRHDWEETFRTTRIDLVLVESAWSAPGQEWFHGVAYHGEEEAADLRSLLGHARELGIPTVFWNREDPVHLRSFRLPAANFGTVLTSDAACIPTYLTSLPSQTGVAASLPFFADPAVLHPAVPERGGAAVPTPVAYAGTYYGARYPQRTRELRGILSIAAEQGLSVYDRQAALPLSPYRLPDDLVQYSRGGVPAEEMPAVYRRHPIHLNVNSVTDSPTMFSRRVVEIASSGSLVLSGQGSGVRNVLGSAFPVLSDEQSWRSALSRYASDDGSWRETVWQQLRTVRRAFTSARSLTLALRIAGIPVRAPAEPRYALLVPASFDGAARTILSQTQLPVAVALSPQHPDREPLERAGIRVIGLDVAAGNLAALIEEDGYIGVLASDLPRSHYEDLLYATSFGHWDRIVSRTSPVSAGESRSIVSAHPPGTEAVPGGLYSRTDAQNVRELENRSDERTFVWISGAGGAAQTTGGS